MKKSKTMKMAILGKRRGGLRCCSLCGKTNIQTSMQANMQANMQTNMLYGLSMPWRRYTSNNRIIFRNLDYANCISHIRAARCGGVYNV